jgi:hypothetical protein
VYSIKSWPCSFCQSPFMTSCIEISSSEMGSGIDTDASRYYSAYHFRLQATLCLDNDNLG